MDHTTKLLNYLEEKKVKYQHLKHDQCRTSAESRQARILAGGDDVIGAKAIVMKMERKEGSGSEFNLFVLPGTNKLNSSVLKQYFKADIKSFRFATTEELAELTGLVPGSIPPFTQPILNQLTHLFVDFALLEHDKIGFNAASLTQSLIIETKDYLRVAKPTDMFAFSQEL